MTTKYRIEEISQETYEKLPNFEISFDIIEMPFGKLFAGFSGKNELCFLSHIETSSNHKEQLSKLLAIYPNSTVKQTKIGKIPENVTLLLKGTEFEMSVWKQLLTIPRGSLVAYKTIAEGVGKPKSSRAVANAIGKNHITFIVPCHRVIRSDGGIGGYSGAGIGRKLDILKYEGIDISCFDRNYNKG